MAEFSSCARCGKIFPNPGSGHTLCPSCRGEGGKELSSRDALRLLKNTLRDNEAKGVLMTLNDVAAATGIDEERVWAFIVSGEIDTASFNDPQVRDYVVKRRRELLRHSGQPAPAAEPAQPQPSRSGFHARTDDGRRR